MKSISTLKRMLRKVQSINNYAEHRDARRRFDNVTNFKYSPNLYCDVNKLQIGEIEINNTCNLNCSMCNQVLSTRQKKNMDLDLFEKVVRYMKQMGCTRTALHTINEPLINPNLESYFKILQRYGVKIFLSTNATVLDKKLDLLIKYSNIIDSLRFSVDGATKETYEMIRRPGKFDNLVNNLDSFKLVNDRGNYFKYVRIGSIVSKEVQHELAYHLSFYSKYTHMKNIDLNLVSGLSPDNTFFFNSSILKKHIVPWSPCDQVFNPMLHVLNDGSVTVCCRDYNGDLVFGNINDNTPEELINNERILQFRHMHYNNKIDPKILCGQCYRIDPVVSDLFRLFVEKLINKHYASWNIDKMQLRFDEFFYEFENKIPSQKTFLRLIN